MFKDVSEAFNHYRTMTIEAIEARAKEINSIIDTNADADIDQFNIELEGLKEAKQNIVEARSAVPTNLKPVKDNNMTTENINVVSTPEYRSAFYKTLLKRTLTDTEKAAWDQARNEFRGTNEFNTVSNAAAVIPTATLNEVISKARTIGGFLPRARMFNMPSKVAIPVGTPLGNASWNSEGAAVDTEKASVAKVDLSDKEIKELSKGLCLHYKLSRGGENLLFDTQTSSWLTAPYTYENSTTDSSSTKTMYTNNCTIQNEKTYTISFLAKKNENANLMFYIYDSSTKLTTHKINVGVNWEEVKINYTATLNSSTIRFRISNYSVANSELKTIGIKNIKLEEGDHATSWLPNKSDTLYSQLGYNNIEPDCSGYGNDGTINGTLTYSNDTPRYEGSYKWNGDNSDIKFTLWEWWKSPYTVSCWVKKLSSDRSFFIINSWLTYAQGYPILFLVNKIIKRSKHYGIIY